MIGALTVKPQLNDHFKNQCSSDINVVPIQQSNNTGDGALFNYSDVVIVSASV